jgi:hypothetical protein
MFRHSFAACMPAARASHWLGSLRCLNPDLSKVLSSLRWIVIILRVVKFRWK